MVSSPPMWDNEYRPGSETSGSSRAHIESESRRKPVVLLPCDKSSRLRKDGQAGGSNVCPAKIQCQSQSLWSKGTQMKPASIIIVLAGSMLLVQAAVGQCFLLGIRSADHRRCSCPRICNQCPQHFCCERLMRIPCEGNMRRRTRGSSVIQDRASTNILM